MINNDFLILSQMNKMTFDKRERESCDLDIKVELTILLKSGK